METEMVRHIPQGGNWKNIPKEIPSKRLAQIRKSGGRTTYYGRLRNNKPSYTISTYFNRIGNGCFIHPTQNRLISIREGARLQSFQDSFIFHGSKTSQYKQVGNAVPPLLARAVADLIEPFINEKNIIDLFSGAGGMSEGFLLQNFKLVGAIEIEKNFFKTFKKNNQKYLNGYFIEGDIKTSENKEKIIKIKKEHKIGVIIGGPPCQGFSPAGWRNPNDKRNELFRDFVHLVKEIKPEFFVMENVPGILSMRNGKTVKEIISCFSKMGYHVNQPMKLKAEEYGVPQLRRRVFIMGSLEKIKLNPPNPLFSFKNKSLPKPITVKEAIRGLPRLKAGKGDFETVVDIKPTSKYEEFMMGKINFKDFYKSKKNSL